jgi:serine/threonine-protein kinase RsbW
MTDTLKISVPGNARYVSTVRLAVSSMANQAGFDIEAIEDIKVAVSEACTNIITHGDIGELAYNVTCAIDTDKLEIAVEDDGVGYDIEKYKEPNLNEPKEGGLGVFIIRALMDDVVVNSKRGSGTSIRMTKYLSTAV